MASLLHRPKHAVSESNDDSFEIIENPNQVESMKTKCAREVAPLLDLVQKHANELGKSPIFHLKSFDDPSKRDDIFYSFVMSLSHEYIQSFMCSYCRHFMKRYGDLCVVNDSGDVVSLCWSINLDDVPEPFKKSVEKVQKKFDRGEVGDEFTLHSTQSTSQTLGVPKTNVYRHFAVTLKDLRESPIDLAQDTTTSYTMLERILDDNSMDVINRVHHMIHDGQLPYAISHKGPTQYLKEVATKLEGVQDPVRRKNMITRFAREAFVGCLSSLRGGMLGYLFECVNEGQTFADVKRNWETKANPLTYLRPTAAPSVGNIESAEKVFARLGFTPRDLERVYLTLDQVPKSAVLWSEGRIQDPVQEITTVQKLFSSVKPKASATGTSRDYSDTPLKPITFRQFAHKVVPTAKTIEVLPKDQVGPYFFTTGKPDAKPIMSFHNEGGHTASWYTWGMQGRAADASLKTEWTPVRAIITFPHMWDHFEDPRDALDSEKAKDFKFQRHGIRMLFCVAGAKEQVNKALCLFPTLLRGEFHGVRSTVETFSNTHRIEDPQNVVDIVGGFAAEEEKEFDIVVAVRTHEGQISRYNINMLQ